MTGAKALVAALLVAGCLSASSTEPVAEPTLRCHDPCMRTLAEGGGWREPVVAVDPDNPDRVVAVAQQEDALARRWLFALSSADGGATWAKTRLPGGPQEGPAHPLATKDRMTDPRIVAVADGTFVVLGTAYEGTAAAAGNTALFTMRSTDGGKSWGDTAVLATGTGVFFPTPVSNPTGGSFLVVGQDMQDNPNLALSPDGTLVTTWQEWEAPDQGDPSRLVRWNDVLLASSTDGGRTWTAPRIVAEGGRFLGATAAFPAEGWRVLWTDGYSDPPGRLHVSSSPDQGATWASSELPFLVSGYNRFTVDARDGLLTLVLAAPAPDGGALLQAASSSDGGQSWTAAETFDNSTEDVIIPASTPLDRARLMVSYHVANGDGTRSFRAALAGHPPLNLDGSVATGTVNQFGQFAWQDGDYFGLAASGGRAFAVWINGAGGSEIRGAWVDVA